METKISLAPQTRDASDMVSIVLEELSRRLGIKVGLGAIPLPGFVKRMVSLSAAEEPANAVLARLFDQISPTGHSQCSYHLLYDPGLQYYMLSIRAVSPPPARLLP